MLDRYTRPLENAPHIVGNADFIHQWKLCILLTISNTILSDFNCLLCNLSRLTCQSEGRNVFRDKEQDFTTSRLAVFMCSFGGWWGCFDSYKADVRNFAGVYVAPITGIISHCKFADRNVCVPSLLPQWPIFELLCSLKWRKDQAHKIMLSACTSGLNF